MSAPHRLSRRRAISLTEIANEPLLALPRSAGPLRDFWLANEARDGPLPGWSAR